VRHSSGKPREAAAAAALLALARSRVTRRLTAAKRAHLRPL